MSEQERIAGQFLGGNVGEASQRLFRPTATPEEIAELRKKQEEQRKAYEEEERKAHLRQYRDAFAMAALTGLLACPHNCEGTSKNPLERISKLAYQYADAMLATREESSQ